MQIPPLPIQPSAAGANPASARANAPANADSQFSQALSRQIEQRQNQPAAPAPAPAPQQTAPAKQQPEQTADNSAAAKPAVQEPDKPAEPKGGSKDSAAAPADEEQRADSAAATAAAAAAPAGPATDMLALVASLNPALQNAIAPAAAAPAADALAPRRVSAAAMPDTAGGLPLKVDAAPAADAGTTTAFQLAAAKSARAAAQPATALKADSAAAPAAGAAPAADLRTPVQPGVAAVADLHARDSIVVPAALKDSGAVAAPLIAPLQQASLGIAQALNGAPTDKLAARVGTPGWDQQLGQKIVWMVAGKEQSASLTLNPPDLGPMQVVLSVNNDHASVTFSSAQPEVRQALENALPKLREMMGESGISLGNASVNAGMPDQRQASSEQARAGAPVSRFDSNGSAADAAVRNAARVIRSSDGLVDTFA